MGAPLPAPPAPLTARLARGDTRPFPHLLFNFPLLFLQLPFDLLQRRLPSLHLALVEAGQVLPAAANTEPPGFQRPGDAFPPRLPPRGPPGLTSAAPRRKSPPAASRGRPHPSCSSCGPWRPHAAAAARPFRRNAGSSARRPRPGRDTDLGPGVRLFRTLESGLGCPGFASGVGASAPLQPPPSKTFCGATLCGEHGSVAPTLTV